MSKIWDIVILGCGRLGSNLKSRLEAEKFNVLGVRRTEVLDDSSFMSLDLDQEDAWEHLATLKLNPRTVLVGIVTSDERTEAAYRKRYLGVAQGMNRLASVTGRQHRLVWVSSTAVFGNSQSGRLDEMAEPMPQNWRGNILSEAEQVIADSFVQHTILRLTGLYTRSTISWLNDPQMRQRVLPDSVSNRIHRLDANRWLEYVVISHCKNIPIPTLIHGVDQGSASYSSIFARLDGAVACLENAKSGRIITTQYRKQMPPLRYPTLDSVIAESP